jgi:hypothetical protein
VPTRGGPLRCRRALQRAERLLSAGCGRLRRSDLPAGRRPCGEGGASGNAPATTVGVNPGVDSGPGALTLTCHEATAVVALGADCSTAAYGPEAETVFTTGTATATVMNECRNPAGAATISLTGEPFDCADWTAEDGPGKLAVVEPLEEPAGTGDAAMGGIIGDAP